MTLLSPFPRTLVPELMDDPALAPGHHQDALRGLARLNAVSGGTASIWRVIQSFCRRRGFKHLRVLDIACGAGDVPVALARRAAKAGLHLGIDACDLSDRALDHGRERADRAGLRIGFFRCDALREPLPGGYDVVMSSLFLHHLGRDEAVAFLKKMGQSAHRMVVVNDLARSRLNLGLVSVATRVVSRSHVVHADGPQSVRAAWSRGEMEGLCAEAGLVGARVRPRFPCRMLVEWERAA